MIKPHRSRLDAGEWAFLDPEASELVFSVFLASVSFHTAYRMCWPQVFENKRILSHVLENKVVTVICLALCTGKART
jgi:hypothetical protein